MKKHLADDEYDDDDNNNDDDDENNVGLENHNDAVQ